VLKKAAKPVKFDFDKRNLFAKKFKEEYFAFKASQVEEKDLNKK
jgi:hypothetical protein